MTKDSAAVTFNNLSAKKVKKSATASYRMRAISTGGVTPTLTVRPATELNELYFNAVLANSKQRIKDLQRGNIAVDDIRQGRIEDRDLYPKNVIVDWSDVRDDLERDVPFSAQSCKAFIAALPDHIFDDLRNFCGAIENFAPNQPDAESEGNA